MVVELFQTAFRYEVLVEETTWQALVLTPKGGGEYHSIGTMEVVRKAVAVILNCQFTTSTTYHNSLHGFQADRGLGTVNLEVKLIQKVTAMRKEVLYVIFMDMHKAYDALDRSRCLDILEGYGMGPRALRLFRRYWDRLRMVVRGGRGGLRRILPRIERRDTGGLTVAHHIQCGNRRNGP